jgi:hypothetical protein
MEEISKWRWISKDNTDSSVHKTYVFCQHHLVYGVEFDSLEWTSSVQNPTIGSLGAFVVVG